MSRIKKAVVLAAGLGSRLKPLTDEVPKCMTEVNGKPILQQTIEILEKYGITETVIVIGYLGERIIEKLGDSYRNLRLKYIWNNVYKETNSMYSAWLARTYLEKGAILIEGDTVFDEALIKSALSTEVDKAYWVLDRFTPEHDGSMSIADEAGRIVDLKIVRGKLARYRDNYFKSTGIVKITPEYGKLFSQWLDSDVKVGNVTIYYDLVIAKHLNDMPIFVCDVTGKQWMEIDSLEDLKKTERIFMPTKYVIVIIDGSADLPVPELGNKTPLEYASIPNIDSITYKGQAGLIRTMYPGLPLGSIVANLGILGYNPLRYYPNGRASFEALAQDIYLEEDEIAFRCNLVSVRDSILTDFTSGNISDDLVRKIVENIKYDENYFKLYPGQSYRNLLIARKVRCNPADLQCFEPHMHVGGKIDELLIKGEGKHGVEIAKRLNDFMMNSIMQIRELNDGFNTSADMFFLWSPSSEPRLPSFHRKYGIDGAIISALDFMRGIGIAARMEARKVSGATGYSDTDMKSKLKYAIDSLKHNDFVFVHINAPDEESHNKDVKAKVQIMEYIDSDFIGPLKDHLDQQYRDKYRLAILPDHYTFVGDGKHGDQNVPYVIYGTGIKPDGVQFFSEKEVEKKGSLIVSYEFMDFFLDRTGDSY